jgi:hypothetical protein
MSAWNYSKKHQEVVEIEEISTALSEKKRCKYFLFPLPRNSYRTDRLPAHCRSTDFFGVETKQRLKTPKVGNYSPELIPKQLPEIKFDSLSSPSRRNDHGFAFTFSRSTRRKNNSASGNLSTGRTYTSDLSSSLGRS